MHTDTSLSFPVSLVEGNNLDGPILSMGLTKDKVTEEGNKTMGSNEEMKDGLANGPGKTYTQIRPKRAVRLPAWLKDYDHSMGNRNLEGLKPPLEVRPYQKQSITSVLSFRHPLSGYGVRRPFATLLDAQLRSITTRFGKELLLTVESKMANLESIPSR
ncbi:hypothetical protein DH2020_044900 [Rehmannia glutinosa]|uniref:Uncharacterized protein n=1 Tax=Rehmannia glutinosa TaxID=99300 RepID=A0ABR0UFP0_REHGL